MPIPKPKTGETKKDFVKRCMSDDIMAKEYGVDQRFAICVAQWEERK